MGAQATEKGNCSKFGGITIDSCKTHPTIIDSIPGDIGNCCKGGVLSAWSQDPTKAVSLFQINVGVNHPRKTLKVPPQNFTFKVPGQDYTCEPTKIVKPTRYTYKKMVSHALSKLIIFFYVHFLSLLE
jgi:hypothetical protein